MSRSEKLRRVDDDTYISAKPDADISRPLEWRRSFNLVQFPMKNVRAETLLSVNDTDLNLDDKQGRNHWADVKPKVEIVHKMIGWVDEDKQRDRLYCLTKTDEEGVFAVERPEDGIEIRLRAGEPLSGHEKIPDGVFYGNLVRCDLEADRDYFCLEAIVPKAQIEELQRALKSNPALEIELSAHVLSFSYEVDDALREWHHSRGLIVRDSTSAPVHCISFSHSTAASGTTLIATSDTDSEGDDKADSAAESSAPATISQVMHTVSTQMASVSRSTSRLTIAVWVGIGLFVLSRL